MGKSKPSYNKPRTNGIFKVAGQNFKTEKKGKPKEVTSKLKVVRGKTVLLIRSLLICIFSRFPARTKRKSAILMIR